MSSPGRKLHWALMSMPSSIPSLDSNSFLPVSELFPLQTPGSINIKMCRNHHFQKKPVNCIISNVCIDAMHSDLPQRTHLPTKIPHSETADTIVRHLKNALQKDITNKGKLSRKLSCLMSLRPTF